MAISHKTQNRWDTLSARLRANDGSRVSLNDCDDYLEILAQNAEGTNGLEPEEKLQAISEGLFNLTYLVIRDKLDAPRSRLSLIRDIAIACRWQITIVALGVCAVLAFRPQIAALIEAALH